jgi:sensor c-di-GMP phosphodiesterase-like protein
VLFSSRTKLVAVVVGVVLAGLPMAAFSFWLDYFIEQQGREEVNLMARRQLALADARVARVVDSLGELARRGFDSCRAVHIEALRQANFATTPIKELSLLGPDGQTLCTDLGIALGMRKVVSSQPLTFDGGVAIEVISLADRKDAMIRLRRSGVDGTVGVAALMPMELFFPQLSNRGGPSNSHARLMTRDGTLLAENGVALPGSADRRFTTTLQSERHNLTAIVSMPREHVLAGHADLRRAGTVVTGVIALAIIGFALIAPARRRDHPADEIERALKAGEFVPYFQPIIDITSGRLRGAEVLVRWRKPDGSLALPAAFIPLLESSGLIFEVTRALMRRARDDVAAAYADRPHLRIGFNLAASHFNDESIVQDVRSIFERSPVRLSQVVLEVTERQPLQNLTERAVWSPPCKVSASRSRSTTSAPATAACPTCSSSAPTSSRSTRCSSTPSVPIATRPRSSRRSSIWRATCTWTSSRRGSSVSSRSCCCAISGFRRRKDTCSRRRFRPRRSCS